jgi:hypothetical protein
MDSYLSAEDCDRVDAKCKMIAIAMALIEGACLPAARISLLAGGYSHRFCATTKRHVC